MIIVTCEDQTLPTHQRQDEYESALSWEVDEHGGLAILGGGANRTASYPSGRWLKVHKDEKDEKSESA